MIRSILGGLLVLLFTACSKKEQARPGSASLMIFNGLPGATRIKTNFSTTAPDTYITASLLLYGSFSDINNLYHLEPGNVPLTLYMIPDTMPKSQPLYNLNLDLPLGSIHSLFLTGTTIAPESILVKDELQLFSAGDSVMGIRFVNLMPENIPVTVNLLSKAQGSEVGNLPYKAVTEFKKYPVKMDVADYVFEFRNAITGDSITSYTTSQVANDGKLLRNEWIYKNFSLALIGSSDSTGSLAPRVALITHARLP